jgi:hypothetical protein
MVALACLAGAGSRYVPSSGGFVGLEEGHWQASIHDLDLWYPRPDASTEVWAYHRRGAVGFERVIPVGVVGNPPWYIVINDGPPGMTVDNDYDSDTYSCLTVPNSETYDGDIDITVYEQGGASINRTWSYETLADTTTHFIHVDFGAAGGGTGTAASPYNDLGDILTTDDQDTTHQGKQVFMTGTCTLGGQAVEYGGAYIKLNGNKPMVWEAVGTATFEGSAANNPSVTTDASAFDFEGGSNCVFAGFNWRNPRVCLVNGTTFRNIFLDASSANFAFGGLFFNDFDLDAAQASDGLNSTAVFFANNPSYDGYVAFYGNTFHDGPFLGPTTIYDTHHMWVCKNVMTAIESAAGWFLKGGDNLEDYAFYFNSGVTGNTGYFSKIQAIDFEGVAPYSRRRIEFMHNIWKSSSGGIWMDGFDDFEYIISSKRNNWKITTHQLDGSDLVTGSAVFDFDIVEATSGTEGVSDDGTTAGFVITRGDNNTTGLDDTTAAQTVVSGTHGAEIA